MRVIFSITFCCLFILSASAQQWVQTNGPEGGRIYSLCAVGSTYFAAIETGVVISTNNGDTWSVSGLNQAVFNLVVAHDTIVYAATRAGIYRSSDRGITWTLTANFSTNLILTKGDTLFASELETGRGFYVSFDNGNSWSAAANNGASPSGYPLTSLVKSGSRLIAGSGAGVFISSDLGNNWLPSSNGINTTYGIIKLYVNGSTWFAGSSLYPNYLYNQLTMVLTGLPLEIYRILLT